VVAAVRAGGGTRDAALQSMQKLLADGIEFDDAKATMPSITRAATASGANAVDIAEIVTKLLKNGFKAAQIDTLIGKGIAAGQAGSFEMKDMAKWLPKLLAAGTMSGMGGMKDYERVLAFAQVSAITAGGSEEAGNNLLNFLLKLNSPETAADAKKHGVDLAGSLAAARAKGMSAPDAFMALLQREADRDPRIVALRKQHASAGNDSERMQTLKAQEQIFQGTAIGKYLNDRQALMSALAVLNNPQALKKVMEQIEAGGAHTTLGNFSLISGTTAFKAEQAQNERLIAQTAALEGLNNALGKAADETVDLYSKYPLLGQAMEATILGINTLTAAAAVASGALLLVGGAIAGKRLMAAGAAGAAGAAAAGAGGAAGAAGLVAAAKAAAAVAAGAVAQAAPYAAAPVVAGLPILAAGVALSEQANSAQGLQSRIAARKARLAELTELSTLDPAGASRYQAEIAALKANLAQLEARLGSRADVQGVQERIATRDARLAEMIDRSALNATGGWYTGGNSAAKGNPAEQPSLLGTPAGGGRNPEVSVNVYLDGQQIQDAVNRRNTMAARRN
jgi:hypothetical protein